MVKFLRISVFATLISCSLYVSAQTSKYKCLLQLTNYTGKGAYIVLSLINPDGKYQKTLYVVGDDDKWYNTLPEWYKFYSQNPDTVDGITGATISGGNRTIINFEIEDTELNKGYKLRFETAVESQEYYQEDVEVPLTDEGLAQKSEGKGYIRYVRFSKI